MKPFSRCLSIFLVALIGGAVGVLGVWFVIGRAETQRTARAEIVAEPPLWRRRRRSRS